MYVLVSFEAIDSWFQAPPSILRIDTNGRISILAANQELFDAATEEAEKLIPSMMGKHCDIYWEII